MAPSLARVGLRAAAMLGLFALTAPICSAQPAAPPPSSLRADDPDTNPYEGRPIREVRFEGLARLSDQFLRNQVRTAPGQPLAWRTVREDLRRLERLGEFRDIQAEVLVDDALNAIVVFRVVEAPIVRAVDVVGNRQLSNDDIREVTASYISLIAGIPVDDFQIGRAQRAIEELYRTRGFYLAQVTVDESELASTGTIIFRVREGERVKVTSIRFEGNESFSPSQVRSVVRTRQSGIFERGAVDDSVLDADVAAIVKFYRDRGYLDARASRRLQPSPDGREVIVTFLIEEGRQYTLRSVEFVTQPGETDPDAPAPDPVYSIEQLRGIFPIKPGDVLTDAGLQRATQAVRDAYRKLGYVDAAVRSLQYRVPEAPLVDVRLSVTEGRRFRTGMVFIQGNDLTQQKVVRRQVEIRPDRWLDATAADDTERRLRDGRLFDPRGVKVTIQPEDPARAGYRDVLVEVQETNTGSLGFGAAVSSDAGLSGLINLQQRNFDLADFPDSFDEFIRGRAFRGAGQSFNLLLQPGLGFQNYSLTITEPYLFETPHALSGSAYFRTREFREYDEQRYGTRFRLARRFGTRWTGGLGLRAESIRLSDFRIDASQDLLDLEGDNFITSISADLNRSTVDSRFRPTTGTYTEFSVEQVGLIGGDFDFTKLNAEHQVYVPIDEDFMGNRTVVSFKARAGYIPQEGEAPLFERYFMGGRSFRGFRFRGIGPRGLRPDGTPSRDFVGGQWSVFFGGEIERPLWREILAGVAFIDSGTLTEESPGFDDYRVSAGLGVRLYIPQFGNAPLAFDFAFPVVEQDGDRKQVFSFSIDIPF